jgi:hypothetical protein
MKQDIKQRLNKKLVDNNMTTLGNKSTMPIQLDESPTKLEQVPEQLYNNYYTLQEPEYETKPTFLQAIVPGNEQLLIVLIFGIAAYAMYLNSKSKK